MNVGAISINVGTFLWITGLVLVVVGITCEFVVIDHERPGGIVERICLFVALCGLWLVYMGFGLRHIDNTDYCCPNCQETYTLEEDYNVCPYCGASISSESEEDNS